MKDKNKDIEAISSPVARATAVSMTLFAGITAVGAGAQFSGVNNEQSALAGLVAEDDMVNPSLGCVPQDADSSGIFGWYAPPQAIPVPFNASESLRAVASGGLTIAAVSDQTLFILEKNTEAELPKFVTEVPALGSTLEVLVAPSGEEIAQFTRSNFVAPLTFIRKSSSMWNPVAAQTILGTNPAYDRFLQRLAVKQGEGLVNVFTRDASGNWANPQTITIAKPSSSYAQVMAWANGRLLISNGGIILSYRLVDGVYALAQTLNVGPLSTNQKADNSFFTQNSFLLQKIVPVTSFGSGFTASWSAPATGPARSYAGNLHSVLRRSNVVSCTSTVITVENQTQVFGFYNVPSSFQIQPTDFDVDAGGIVVIQRFAGNSVNYILRDRVFGGANPEPGSTAVAGQGGFE